MIDLTDSQQDALRSLRRQNLATPDVDALVRLGLAEPVPTDQPDYHAVRLTALGREMAENDDAQS